MSITYRIVSGDTLESISRKVYGSETDSSLISKANPGLGSTLTPGTEIVVPSNPNAIANKSSQLPSASEDETALLIEGERFRFWDKIRIVQSIDSLDIVEFGAPFESNAPNFKEIFRPFSYKSMSVSVGGQPLFTGTMVSITPVVENSQKVISVSGYSTPGVLEDCTPPASSYPLEFNGQSLRGIASTICAPFGLSVEFRQEPGAVFDRVACEPGTRNLSFLSGLARQRNFVISSTALGKLLFWRSVETGNPVAKLEQGASPVLSVTPQFEPQEYHSHITGIEPVIVGLAGAQISAKNPHLTGVVRPLTFTLSDTDGGNVKNAVDTKIARMFGNAAAYAVEVDTWRDPNGELWQKNTTLTLLAPDVMVYQEYEFLIRTVEFSQESNVKTAILTLVLPGAFSGELPERLPWDA